MTIYVYFILTYCEMVDLSVASSVLYIDYHIGHFSDREPYDLNTQSYSPLDQFLNVSL